MVIRKEINFKLKRYKMTKLELIETIEKYVEENLEVIDCRNNNNKATILVCLETVLQTAIDSLNRCKIEDLK